VETGRTGCDRVRLGVFGKHGSKGARDIVLKLGWVSQLDHSRTLEAWKSLGDDHVRKPRVPCYGCGKIDKWNYLAVRSVTVLCKVAMRALTGLCSWESLLQVCTAALYVQHALRNSSTALSTAQRLPLRRPASGHVFVVDLKQLRTWPHGEAHPTRYFALLLLSTKVLSTAPRITSRSWRRG
jgi:hypothetical protein